MRPAGSATECHGVTIRSPIALGLPSATAPNRRPAMLYRSGCQMRPRGEGCRSGRLIQRVHQDRASAAGTGKGLAHAERHTRPWWSIEAHVPDLPGRQAVRTVEVRECVALPLGCVRARLEGWIAKCAAAAAEASAGKVPPPLFSRCRRPSHRVAPRAPDVHLEAKGQQLAKRGEGQRYAPRRALRVPLFL
jgi:hypothetical protein